MILWRITTGAHPVWSDEDARRHGGRWNVPGQGLIYAALAYSTAMLEILIHANTGRAPSNARYVAADISEDVAVEALDPAQLPGWDGADLAIPQAFGAGCWAEQRSAVLLVPPVVTKVDRNAVVNPAHPDAVRITVSGETPAHWNVRLFPPRA